MLVIFYQIQYASSLHRLLGSFQDQDVRFLVYTSIIIRISEINKINTGLCKLELNGNYIHFQTHVSVLFVHQSGQVERMKQMNETLSGPEVTKMSNLKTGPKIIRIIMTRTNIVFDFLSMESGVITIVIQ